MLLNKKGNIIVVSSAASNVKGAPNRFIYGTTKAAVLNQFKEVQKLYGRHSLEAWGYRLKCNKGDFGKHEGCWDVYTPEMLSYCITDTLVTLKLYQLMLRRMETYSS